MSDTVELICDGCFRPITKSEWRIYRGWRFSGTASHPPKRGDTTHMTSECQHAYVARRLYGPRRYGGWSMARIARSYDVPVSTVRKWIKANRASLGHEET